MCQVLTKYVSERMMKAFIRHLFRSVITGDVHGVSRILSIVGELVDVTDDEVAVWAMFDVIVRYGHPDPNDFMGVISAIMVPLEPNVGILASHVTLQCDISPLPHHQIVPTTLKLHDELAMATCETQAKLIYNFVITTTQPWKIWMQLTGTQAQTHDKGCLVYIVDLMSLYFF